MLIRDLLRAIDDDLRVYIKPVEEVEWLDEHYNVVYGSWKGNSNHALIAFDTIHILKRGGYVPLKTLKPILEDLISGRLFEGYKGGLHSFNKDTPIHFEWANGDYSDIPLIDFVREQDKAKFKKYFYQYFK